MVSMHHLKVPAFGCWVKRAFTTVTSLKPLQLHKQQLRSKATHVDCKHLEPKCGDRFKLGPCVKQQTDIKLTQPAPQPLPLQERSTTLKRSSECCGSSCPDTLPRFDLLYYKRTNKFNCEYQQTWDECPELLKKPKIKCCFDQIKPAKLEKRPRQQRPQTACHQTCESTKAKCPYITSRGCRPAKQPPKCRPVRVKIDCKKRKVPSAAFSECMPQLPKTRPVECRCLLTPSICEVWAYYN